MYRWCHNNWPVFIWSYRGRLGINGMVFVYLRLHEGSQYKWTIKKFLTVHITRGWTHVCDYLVFQFHDRKIMRIRVSFGKCRYNLGSRATLTAGNNIFDVFKPCQTSYFQWNMVEYLSLWNYQWIMLWSRRKKYNIEIYNMEFILKQRVFASHLTLFNTGRVQFTHRVVIARIMHIFFTDLVRNPTVLLVESWK